MANVTAKALASHRELVDHLKYFVAATLPVVVDSYDSDGSPITTFSADATPAAGEKVVVLRTKAIDWATAKDSLGNTAIQYAPHVFQICTEANFAGTTDNVADILVNGELLFFFVEAGRRGSFVEWYQSANATVPAVAQMTAANLKGQWRDLYFNIQKAS